MININLLNWRENQKIINNHIFYLLSSFVAVLTIIITYLVIFVVVDIIGDKQGDINFLNKEIADVEKKIVRIKGLQEQKKILLERRRVIEGLQTKRILIVKVLDNIASITPGQIVINNMAQNDNDLLINGESDNNAEISEFLRRIQEFDWVKEANLNEISASAGTDENSLNGKIKFEIKIVIGKKNES